MRRALALALGLCACASAAPALRPQPVAPRPVPTAPAAASWTPAEDTRSHAALDAWRARLLTGDGALLRELGVTLARAGQRSVEITGDAAPSERVDEVREAARFRYGASVLLRTSCGNAWVLGLLWQGEHWVFAGRLALLEGRLPGHCYTLRSSVESRAIVSDNPQDAVFALDAADTVGEVALGPSLWIVHVDERGALRALLEREPFGVVDERSGEVVPASLLVVEDLPAPREVYVSGRLPPTGQRQQRRYRLRDGALRLQQATGD